MGLRKEAGRRRAALAGPWILGAATVELALEVVSGALAGKGRKYTIDVLTPSGASMKQNPGTALRHTRGLAGVGFKGIIFLEPKDVLFSNIQFREGTVKGIGSGFYASLNGLVHATGSDISVASCSSTTGCKVQGVDEVDTGDNGPPFSVGSFLWPIPWEFRLPGKTYSAFTTANHSQAADAAGKASIGKAGAGPFSKNAADPSSTF